MSRVGQETAGAGEVDWASWGALLLLVAVWGSTFLLTTVALEDFHPLFVAGARVALAAVAVAAISVAMGPGLPRGRVAWGWSAAVGILSLTLPFTLMSWSLLTVPTGVAAIYFSASPIFILALARIFLGEPITARRAAGFVVGFAGVVWLTGGDQIGQIGAAGQTLPQLAAAAVPFSFACGTVAIRMMPPLNPIQATAGAQICGAAAGLPLLVAFAPGEAPAAAPAAALVWLGVVHTGLGQMLRYYTIRRAGPVFMAKAGYMIPIWAGLLGVVFLGERPGVTEFLAYGLIIAGLTLAGGGPRRGVTPSA